MVKILYKEKIYFSIIFLYYYSKIIGLCPLNLDYHNLEFQTSFVFRLYAILISILYIFSFFWSLTLKYKIIYSHRQIDMTSLVDGFVHISQLLAVIFIWLTFAFRQKRLKNIFKNLQITKKFSEKLKIPNDTSDIIQIIIIWTLVVFSYFTPVFIVDQIFHSTMFSSYNLIIWGFYRYSHIVIHHVYFLFISILQIIEQKFLHLNIVLKKCATEEMLNREIFEYR